MNKQTKKIVTDLVKISEKKCISQTEIAKRIGVERSNLNRTFRLKQSPNLSTVCDIATVLGVEIIVKE